MSKGTTIKDAIAKWEEKNGVKAVDSPVVKLCGLNPPIEKMDGTLGLLVHCEKLSLSTNAIDKIANLTNLRNLKILSLGRNMIKTFAGLEAVGDVLEELWISYNLIDKTKGCSALKKCKVLYMSNNLVKDPKEFEKFNDMPSLVDLVFVGNPIEEAMSAEDNAKWREFAATKLPRLKKLDGLVVLR